MLLLLVGMRIGQVQWQLSRFCSLSSFTLVDWLLFIYSLCSSLFTYYSVCILWNTLLDMSFCVKFCNYWDRQLCCSTLLEFSWGADSGQCCWHQIYCSYLLQMSKVVLSTDAIVQRQTCSAQACASVMGSMNENN